MRMMRNPARALCLSRCGTCLATLVCLCLVQASSAALRSFCVRDALWGARKGIDKSSVHNGSKRFFHQHWPSPEVGGEKKGDTPFAVVTILF